MAPTSWLALLTAVFSQSVHTSIPQSALTTPSMLLVPPPLSQNNTRILPPDEIAEFRPYTWFAATTACNISDIMTWTCGKNCDANPTFIPIDTGGDGNDTQFWFSGYDQTLDEVIVSHQGSDIRLDNLGPLYTILNVTLGPLNSTLFPNIDQSILVHQGFAGTHNRSAPDVIRAVKKALSQYSTKKVTVVGPSLGGAIVLLDAVLLPLVLPEDVTVRYVGYGTPRVGNQAFADYVDAQGMSIRRLNNRQDPVPLVPTREFFEYHHPSGEIHVRNSDGAWVECLGQDNPDEQCSTGAVTFTTAVFSDHNKEFDGVYMGEC